MVPFSFLNLKFYLFSILIFPWSWLHVWKYGKEKTVCSKAILKIWIWKRDFLLVIPHLLYLTNATSVSCYGLNVQYRRSADVNAVMGMHNQMLLKMMDAVCKAYVYKSFCCFLTYCVEIWIWYGDWEALNLSKWPTSPRKYTAFPIIMQVYIFH